MSYNPQLVWTGMIVYFVVFETIGIYHELANKKGDVWTFTHYITQIPMGAKVAVVAWLAYHFLIEHPKG